MSDTPRRRSVVGTIVGVFAAVAVPLAATTIGALGAVLFVAAKHSGPDPVPTLGPDSVAEETISGSGTTHRTADAELAL